MTQFESLVISQPKIKNGSKISLGTHNKIGIITDKHFNKFQKLMIRVCFGLEVEDYSE